MTPLVAFVLGLLIGWLVEFVIDWFYWRRRYRVFQDAAEQCQQKLGTLESELTSARIIVQPLNEKISQLNQEVSRLELEKQQLKDKLDDLLAKGSLFQPVLPEESQPVNPDDLQEIKGIGLVISKRLNHHKIYTFEQLASQTPENLREILGDLVQRLADEESYIEQARQFAYKKQLRKAGEQ